MSTDSNKRGGESFDAHQELVFAKASEKLFGYDLFCRSRNGCAFLLDQWPKDLLDLGLDITTGPSRNARNWTRRPCRLGDLWWALSRPQVGPKDGIMFLPAALKRSKRLKDEVESIGCLTLDVDGGQGLADAIQALQEAGYCYLLYTSHSHHKTQSDIDAKALGLVDIGDVTDADIQSYLVERGSCEAIAKTATVTGILKKQKGVFISVKHDPIDKYRIMLPLSMPFVVSRYMDPQAVWRQFLLDTAASLGLQIDKSCTDLGRGFFSPRKAPDRPYICVAGGMHALEPPDPASYQVRKETKVESRKKRSLPSKTRPPGPNQEVRTCHKTRALLRDAGPDLDLVGFIK